MEEREFQLEQRKVETLEQIAKDLNAAVTGFHLQSDMLRDILKQRLSWIEEAITGRCGRTPRPATRKEEAPSK